MFNFFRKKMFSAADAHFLFLNAHPRLSKIRGNQKTLDDILGTIKSRARLGYRTLWVSELSEENRRILVNLQYKVSETFDKNGYYIQW